MGLRILHSADWHLDSPFASFPPDRQAFLKAAQRKLPGQIAMACRENQCDLVLLAGDLFDGPCSPESLDLLRDSLAECRVPVMISPGNHDPWGPDCPWLELWPDNVWIFPPHISSLTLKDLDARVYGAGFSSMDSPSLLEGFRAEGEETWQIGVFHGDPTSAVSHYNPVTTAQIRECGLQYLALGHIHKGGGLEIGPTVCGWPGCPMGRGWDETGEKGYLLVELGEQTRVETRTLETPRFFQQTLELEGDAAQALEAYLPPVPNDDFYRITLAGYGRPDMLALRKQFGGFRNLTLRDQTVDPTALWAQAGEDSLRGAYFARLQQRAEEAQDPELRRTVLLAAEISRKLLEGREVLLP